MAWQPYVDTQLVGMGNISQALICSATDGSVWGTTPDFALRFYRTNVMVDDGSEKEVEINEIATLLELCNNGTRPPHGLRLNGEKFQILRTASDPTIVYAKKPKGGACIYKTNSCIIIGVFDENMTHTAGGCNTVVERLGEYLRTSGY